MPGKKKLIELEEILLNKNINSEKDIKNENDIPTSLTNENLFEREDSKNLFAFHFLNNK